MKIATWNINSVRLRVAQVVRFLQENQPDALCLQEIKAQNGQFPADDFAKLGYVHQAVNGQKAYNGVAIISKLPFTRTFTEDFCREGHARHICAVFENGVELHDFYVPAGGDIPDAEQNEKFDHKLDFLHRMIKYYGERSDRASARVVAVGDFNIAPLETDVWNHKQLIRVVSHTPLECRLFGELERSFEFTSAVRHFVPESERIYSWWSYRAKDALASDRGRLLDHILVSPALKGTLKGQTVFRDMRAWERCSDHIPMMAELNL